MDALKLMLLALRSLLLSRAGLAAENLALRQQLAVLRRRVKRQKLTRTDRLFWIWLSRLWTAWRLTLAIVEPETVVLWHQAGFRLFWRWKSRAEAWGGRRWIVAHVSSRNSEKAVAWVHEAYSSAIHLLAACRKKHSISEARAFQRVR